ncbi:hypothetical protein HJFPF1_06329 [Paramyrothecium foliicola]|nr:hypothetical protein HJFPF1_06329 [Paramyrothecium foliicola]
MATRAMIIPMSTFGAALAKDILPPFVKVLEIQENHTFTPHMPVFVQIVDLLYNIEGLQSRHLTELRLNQSLAMACGQGHSLELGRNGHVTAPKAIERSIQNSKQHCAMRFTLHQHVHVLKVLIRDMRDNKICNNSAYLRKDLKLQHLQHETEVFRDHYYDEHALPPSIFLATLSTVPSPR